MSKVTINIHDLPREVYDRLPSEEEEHNGTRWKRIETPSSIVTYFRRWEREEKAS